ncbi:Chaperone protein ClpB1 [Apostasia shenzhenica]|uniref:Chaperone protein ClpB1 n=1 Tax=Apostasia shenzhenica TaxID=1088818 RepID=A0A2I0A751_9ASPA|nr:Chaperone protein ClpB1 [Apostasia shenzhenica]
MRAGACTIQQALTAEAAAIVKLSVNLARRRGHAQVTPLHVATTLLNSSASASYLLRRACIRSRPQHPSSLSLHCRALELCFNVALNRLPTSPPPSSSSLLHSNPSLSNALIAALKRAQAHQRRGCIESQNIHLHQSQQQSNQPLLAIKVELEQLIISILDDPSVSRVMREAGFSSTSVKQNLEEESTAGFAMAPSAKPQSLFYDPNSVFLPTHFLKPIERKEEDVKVVLEAMTRRKHQGKRSGSAVVVGDNASFAEGVANDLMFKFDRGEVPEELKGAQIMKLQLSYVHLRLMSRGDLEMKITDLRRRVISSVEKGVVVYAGDLRWVVDDEEGREKDGLSGFNPVDYFISEVGKFINELKHDINGRGAKVWLLASSSYQTYMKCKMMNPSIEHQWSLQTVVVPSGGLALSLQSPSGRDSLVPKLNQFHFEMKEARSFSTHEEGEKLLCCAECIASYEKEAKDSISGTTHLPFWLQTQRTEKLHKEGLVELRRKWNRLCKTLHHTRTSQFQSSSLFFNQKYSSSHPWWSCSLPCSKSKFTMEPSSVSFTSLSSRKPLMPSFDLGVSLLTDSATSTNQKMASPMSLEELTQKLKENIPWQPEVIPLIVDQLFDHRISKKKGKNWMIIHGNDQIAKRRLARVVAKSFFGSSEEVIIINARKSANGALNLLKGALVKESKRVVLIEGMNWAGSEFINSIKDGIEIGSLKDSCGRDVDLTNGIFILTTTSSTEHENMEEICDRVLKMRMWIEKEHPQSSDRPTKKLRLVGRGELDLNVAVDGGEEEDGAPSDLTHEAVGDSSDVQLSGVAILTLEINRSLIKTIAEDFATRLRRAFEEVVDGGDGGKARRLVVDAPMAEELARASGCFLEAEFDKWVREVFQICIPTVQFCGVLRLGVEGKDGNLEQLGFMESVLPKKILVD